MTALLLALWLCVSPAAHAARWTEPRPLEVELDDSGTLELPAGEVVHLTPSRPGVAIEVSDRLGHPVRLVPRDGGLLVAAHYFGRRLEISLPPDVTVTVSRPSDRGQAVAWEQWEAGVWRALRAGAPLPAGPEGSAVVVRNAEARREAGVSEHVVQEGFIADSTLARPVARTAFEPPVPLDSGDGRPRTMTVEGPARIRIVTEWTEGEGLQDGWLVWHLDDGSDRRVPLRAGAGTRRGTSLYVPRGAHRLALEVQGPAARVDVVARRLRPSVSWPAFGDASETAVDAAELAYLSGDHEAALAGWASLVDAPGARGWLARARVLELSSPSADLETLATLDAVGGGAAAELVAAQIVARGAAVAPEQVIEALVRTPDPDLFDVAAFLDTYSVHRPLGTGALQSAFPVVPVDAGIGWETAAFLSRRSSLRTLEPDGAGVPVVRLDGPGIERRIVTPEAVVSAQMPPGPLGRAAVLRLRCDAACAFEVRGSDGRTWAYQGDAGRYDTALPAGSAVVEVQSGAVVVLDPELVEGGARAVERLGAALPADWEIPGGGVPVELRLDASPDGTPVTASFDDGTVLRVAGRRLVAPAGATRVHIEGSGVRSLAMRVRHTIAPLEVDSTSVSCEGALLDVLEERSRRIGGGEAALDLDRARILGCLGLPSLARADLRDASVSGDPIRTAAAEALEEWLKTTLPDAPMPGPTGVHGTLALVGEGPASGPESLERFAAAHPEVPHLEREIARAWVHAADHAVEPVDRARFRLHALRAAWAAGGTADDLLSGLEARMDWRDVSLAETSAGVPEAVIRARRTRVVSPVGLAEAAMMAWPWPTEHAVLLRDDGGERIRVPPGASARVDVACRDLESSGRDCRVRLQASGSGMETTTWTETVEVGPPKMLALPEGMEELELRGPGEGRRMSVRLKVDGELMPPVSVRRVLRARPGEPVRLTVSSPTAVSVVPFDDTPFRVVATERGVGGQDGDASAPETIGPVRAERATAGVPSPPTLVLANGAGRLWDLRIEGDGRVQVQLGVPRPADDAGAVEAPETPEPNAWLPEVLDENLLDEVLGRFRFPSLSVGPGPIAGGTWELDLAVGRDQQFAPTEPWEVGEVEVLRYGRRDALWGVGSVWLRGPTGATGVTAEGGLRLENGWAGVRARAGAGRDIAASRAGSVDARGFVVRDVSIRPDLRLRWDALLDGRWSSEPPLVRVDPRAWTPYRVDHPVFMEGGLGLISEPKRELRLDVSLRGRSNTAASLDRLMLQAGVDRLLQPRTLVSGNIDLVARFADAHRARSDLSPRARVRVQHALVQDPGTHVRLWSEAWSMPLGGAWEAWVGVRLIGSPGRGLRDLPPHREVFRSAMEGP